MTLDDSDLADRLAVQDVIVNYANCIDDKEWEAYRSCFAPDVEMLGFGPEPIRGIDAWLQFVEKALESYRQTQHMLGPPNIQITGDVAHMRTDLQALHWATEPAGKVFSLWGAYRTDLARSPDGWRMTRHQLDVWATRTEGS